MTEVVIQTRALVAGVRSCYRVKRVLKRVGVSLFILLLGIAESRAESACAELLTVSPSHRPALIEVIERSGLWDVMPTQGGDWVAMPTDEAFVLRQVLALSSPVKAPREIRVAWSDLGVNTPTLDPLRGSTGAFVPSLDAYLFHIDGQNGADFYLIDLVTGRVTHVNPTLKLMGKGKWDFVGEDIYTGDLFFRRAPNGRGSPNILVRVTPRGKRKEWSVRKIAVDAFRYEDVQTVQSVADGAFLLVGVRKRGLLLLDAQTQAVVQEVSEKALEQRITQMGLPPAQMNRYFWDRVHVSEDGMRVAFGISRMNRSGFLAPMAFTWDIAQGTGTGLDALRAVTLGYAAADVYDWVFSEDPAHPGALYVFGTRITDDHTTHSILWRWRYLSHEAPEVMDEGRVKTPFVASGAEMESRIQRELVRNGWVLTSGSRALSPSGHWIQLPTGGDQVLSWSLFRSGIYTLKKGQALDYILQWVPFSQ